MKIADPKPAYCSACHSSSPELRYVDFECAYDGGSMPGGLDGYPGAVIDDLVLCEACVRTAAKTVAVDPLEDENRRREIEVLKKEASDWKAYARQMEVTLPMRPGRPLKQAERVEA